MDSRITSLVSIKREHVLQALKKIDEEGVPARRDSKKYLLVFEGQMYPPKYTVAIANIFANGRFLESDDFGGGAQTNNLLRKLGFYIY